MQQDRRTHTSWTHTRKVRDRSENGPALTDTDSYASHWYLGSVLSGSFSAFSARKSSQRVLNHRAHFAQHRHNCTRGCLRGARLTYVKTGIKARIRVCWELRSGVFAWCVYRKVGSSPATSPQGEEDPGFCSMAGRSHRGYRAGHLQPLCLHLQSASEQT